MKLLAARRFEFAAMAFFSAAFLFIALFRIGLPGIYYDEALFIPPSAKLFDSCALDAVVFFKIRCLPIILQPPYLGSLKAVLYAPIFGAAGVGVISIRLPGILILLASNLAFWWFWRPRIGHVLALLLFAVMSLDAASIFHARVDWGPYVLQNACKLAVLCLIVAWLETRAPRHLALACLLVFVGIFDKLNFLWFVPAFTLAICLVYGSPAIRAFREHVRINSVILLVSILIGTIWFVKLIIPIAIAGTNNAPFVLSAQFARILSLVTGTLDGGAYLTLFGTPWPGSTWLSAVAFASTFAGLGLLPLLALLRRFWRDNPDADRIARYSTMLAVINSVLFACLVVTKEVGGSHHAIVFSHFWQLQFITLIGAATTLAVRTSRAIRGPVMAAAATLCVALMALNAASVRHHLAALDPRHRFSAAFSPASYDLARIVQELDVSEVASVDWGIHNVIFALAPIGQRARYSEMWPTFNELGLGHLSPADATKIIRGKQVIAFVTRPIDNAVFPNTVKGFAQIVRTSPECASSPRIVADALGREQYAIYLVARECLV